MIKYNKEFKVGEERVFVEMYQNYDVDWIIRIKRRLTLRNQSNYSNLFDFGTFQEAKDYYDKIDEEYAENYLNFVTKNV